MLVAHRGCAPYDESKFVQCGIVTCKADWMAHVLPHLKTIMVYPTWRGREAVQRDPPPDLVEAKPKGIVMGHGWVVKPKDIEELWDVSERSPLVSEMLIWDEWDPKWNTSQKGRFAEQAVIDAIEGKFMPPFTWARLITDVQRQRKGQDLWVGIPTLKDRTMEAKCDFGHALHGNLYLQRDEINPKKMH